VAKHLEPKVVTVCFGYAAREAPLFCGRPSLLLFSGSSLSFKGLLVDTIPRISFIWLSWGDEA